MTLLRRAMLAAVLPTILTACGGGGGGTISQPSVPLAIATPLAIAVVGDSISLVEVLPDSTVPCGGSTSLPCDFSVDGSKSYPALVAAQTGALLTNLAQAGSLTIGTVDVNGIAVPGVEAMVRDIPVASNVVIWESGLNDIAFSGAPAVPRIGHVAEAIHARMPRAHVIVIGVRYFSCGGPGRCYVTAINDWDGRERAFAAKYKWTFVDLRAAWPASIGPDWPDGRHPGPRAVAGIAALVESAIGHP